MVIEPTFDFACDFHEGLARVAILPDKVSPTASEEEQERPPEMKWGFIDKTGAFVIAPRFSRAADFANGRATVFVGTKEHNKEYKVDAKGTLYEVKKE